MPIYRNSPRDLLLLIDFESDSPSFLNVAYIHGGANREEAAKWHDVGISICQPFNVVVTGLVYILLYIYYTDLTYRLCDWSKGWRISSPRISFKWFSSSTITTR